MIIRAHYDVMVIVAEEEEHVTGQNFEADNLPRVLKIEYMSSTEASSCSNWLDGE